MQGMRKTVDNVFVFDQGTRGAVRGILRLCEEKRISLNRDKFRFCHPQAHFAGFTLTPEGNSVSNDIINAITNFPTPSSRTDLHGG